MHSKKPASKFITASKGFTIVELLVVIVVIGILATITIVSYTGITQKANVSLLLSDLSGAANKLKLDQAMNSAYPATLDLADEGRGIKTSSAGSIFSYSFDNVSSPQTFCIAETKDNVTYKITDTSAPVLGDCLNYGLALDLDAGNVSSYPGSGTSWSDLGQYGNNGTLYNSTSFSATNGGTISFDGVDDYVHATIPQLGSFTQPISISTWLYIPSSWTWSNGGIAVLTNNVAWGMGIFRSATNNSIIFTSRIGNTATYGTINYVIARDTWYHLTFVGNGTSLDAYANGVKIGGSPANYGFGPGADLTKLLRIGSSNIYGSNGGNYLNGYISNVRLYTRTLSSTEVVQSFDLLKSRYGL